MKQSILIAVLLFPTLISLAPAEKAPKSASHDVSIKGMQFTPGQLQINVGDSVTWTNQDDRDHTVVSQGNFKSGNLGKGDTFQHTFAKAGKFNYACTYHPRMKGVVVVGGN